MILRRNYPQQPSDLSLPKPSQDPSLQQYQILLEFDLKRQKEKNMILEQRLKNKEVFIQQMKHFQQELTTAYEQCKNDLIIAQEKIEYLQNVQFREYTEQISDLRHMLMVKSQQSKRNSITRDQKFVFSTFNHKIARNKSEKGLGKNCERRESKTSSNFATHRERSSGGDKFQNEVSRQIKKSANFIAHFLQMSEIYLSEVKAECKLTKKLKKSWKWIKEVVKQWDHLSTKVKSLQKFKEGLSDIFKIEKDMDLSIMLELIKSRQEIQN